VECNFAPSVFSSPADLLSFTTPGSRSRSAEKQNQKCFFHLTVTSKGSVPTSILRHGNALSSLSAGWGIPQLSTGGCSSAGAKFTASYLLPRATRTTPETAARPIGRSRFVWLSYTTHQSSSSSPPVYSFLRKISCPPRARALSRSTGAQDEAKEREKRLSWVRIRVRDQASRMARD
jgi:hypothetical protein